MKTNMCSIRSEAKRITVQPPKWEETEMQTVQKKTLTMSLTQEVKILSSRPYFYFVQFVDSSGGLGTNVSLYDLDKQIMI